MRTRLRVARVTVGSRFGRSREDIRDIRGPKIGAGSWVLPAVLAGAIVVALCAYVVRRRRHRGTHRRTLTLSEQTLERLENTRPLMRPATAREFGIAASEVIRNYIEKRFDVIATQRTTEEFLQTLLQSSNEALARHRSLLAEFLQQCDFVKFAGASLAVTDMESLFQSARGFVLETGEPPPHDPVSSARVVLGLDPAAAHRSVERPPGTGRRGRIFRCQSRARCRAPHSEPDRWDSLVAADHRGGSHDRRVGPAAAHSQSYRSHGERN